MASPGTVMVTGATGLVGRPLVRHLLSRGHRVLAVARRPGEARPGLDGIAADLSDPSAAAALVAELRPDALVHLAWTTEHGAYWTDPGNARWLEAGKAMVEAFHRSGGRRLVVAGTCAEYRWDGSDCDETSTPLEPHTPYGEAKAALFAFCRQLSARHGLSFAWARIFLTFGPGEHPGRLVPQVLSKLLRGERARLTLGTQVRDFLFSEDLADAFRALVDSDLQGAVNLGSGEPMALRDFVIRLARRLDREDLLDFGAIPDRPGDPARLVPVLDRLHRDLGWRPPTGLDQALDRTVAAARAASAPPG